MTLDEQIETLSASIDTMLAERDRLRTALVESTAREAALVEAATELREASGFVCDRLMSGDDGCIHEAMCGTDDVRAAIAILADPSPAAADLLARAKRCDEAERERDEALAIVFTAREEVKCLQHDVDPHRGGCVGGCDRCALDAALAGRSDLLPEELAIARRERDEAREAARHADEDHVHDVHVLTRERDEAREKLGRVTARLRAAGHFSTCPIYHDCFGAESPCDCGLDAALKETP